MERAEDLIVAIFAALQIAIAIIAVFAGMSIATFVVLSIIILENEVLFIKIFEYLRNLRKWCGAELDKVENYARIVCER